MNVGDKVTINKDIHRVDHMTRIKCLYSSQGETGIIIEIFRPKSTAGGGMSKTLLSAKVKMDDCDNIKTFRLTSLTLNKQE
jgi:hypothetical protein